MQGYVAVVDAYSAARFFPAAFRVAGYGTVRVQSTPRPPRIQSGPMDFGAYAADLRCGGDLEETVRALAPYEPVAVLAGYEVGVPFADRLSERLGLPTNGTALSPARRDKYVMNDVVAQAGLPAVRQLLVTDEQQVTDWHREIGGRVVLKPTDSAAGDNVSYCDTPEQARLAYRKILGSDNVYVSRTERVVAQEYLVGTEYMVNSVSSDGRHHTCDIWRTARIAVNGTLDICTVAQLEPCAGPVQDRLVDYAHRVLDALDIRWGPTHLEVKLTPRGPVLIEVGNRLCGGEFPRFVREAVGESQYEWTVDAYVRPDRFADRYAQPYEIRRHLASVALVSPVGGTFRGLRHRAAIERLESFRDLELFLRPGDRLRPTVDDTTYVGQVRLLHEVEEIVRRDANTIEYLDGTGMYDVD